MRMKGGIFSILMVSLCVLSACHKQRNHKATVVRDCTGVYLRWNEKDYHVCNTEKLAPYADGTAVNARFRKANDCPEESDKIVCMMYHENEGWIEITAIE